MAFKLEPGVEYISHEDPEHDHIDSLHDYDSCEPCKCAEVKEVGQHCQHCYHCPPCSSAVAMGCRPCPSSPDISFYLSYIVRDRKDGDYTNEFWFNHDCDKVKDGTEGAGEWCSCMEPLQSPEIYPNSPSPFSNEEDTVAEQAESKKTPQETPPKQ